MDSRQITIRQLLSHTSGLPLGDVFTLYTPGEPMPTLQEKLMEEVHPIREPREAFFLFQYRV
jgi:Beta-lactamase.